MTYNEIIQKAGRSILKRVYYIENDVKKYINDEDVERVKPSFNAPLIGTVMLGIGLELKTILPNKPIYVEVIASFNKVSASKIYGPYYLKGNPTYNADEKTYSHQLYDNMIISMVDYTPIDISFPCTIYEYFSKLVEEIGYVNGVDELPNGNLEIEYDIYEGIDFTRRDVLHDLGQANGVLFYIEVNTIKIASLGKTSVTIDDDILKNTNISFGEHFGPINSIVLSRSADSDSIYLKDEESIASNGLTEFKISDNQLMNNNNRSEFLPAILNQLNGIEYDIFDVELIGYGGFEPLQKVEFQTGDNTYYSYVFNNDIEITAGYSEAIYTDMPEETKTNYSASSKSDKLKTEIYLIADKQNKKIEAVIQENETNSEKISNMTQTLDEISTEVSNAAVYKRIVKGLNDLVTEEAANTNVLKCTLYCTESITSEIILSIICRDKPRGEAANVRNLIAFKIPSLKYKDDIIRDFITIKENSFFITRKIDENDNVLDEPVTEELTLESSSNVDNMILVEGINYIMYSISPNTGGTSNQFEMEVEYLLKNDFTDRFASKVEVDSKISQTSTQIMTEVNKKVDEEEFGSKITQNAESVQVAWNQIGQNVKLEPGEDGKAKFNIYDENDNLLMSLDINGMTFYSSELLGKMGIVTQGDNKYIAFNVPIDYDSSIGNGFAWGVTNNTTGTFYPILYLKDFYMGPEQSDIAGGELILANCGLTIEGQNRFSLGNIMIMAQDPISGDMTFIDKVTGKTLFSITPGNDALLTYDTIKILSNISMYVNQEYADVFKIGTDETNSVWATSNGYLYALQLRVGEDGISTTGGINAGGDIQTSGYVTGHIIDLSDAESKMNIEKYEKSALEEIKNTDIYSFLYKQGNLNKKTIGAVIGKKYNCSDEIISEDGKHITLYSMISLAYKAIQEQQTEIEELKEKILKLEGIINENNSK